MLKIFFGTGLALLLATSTGSANTNLVRVALFDDAGAAGKGVPRVTELARATPDIKVTRVSGNEIASGTLTNYDVVVFTGGSGSKQAAALGEKGREEVRRFVGDGGGYIGICAGAYLACSGYSWGIGVLNAKPVSSKWARGKGNVEMEITAAGEAITTLPSGKQEILYANGPIIQPGDQKDIPAYEPIAFFRTELAKNGTPVGIMVNSPAMARGTYGKGRVLISSPHPEQTSSMENFVPASIRWTAGRMAP